MAKTAAKKAVTKTGRKTGTLVPQPHGGAILNGMAPNHVPGPGRPPDEIRAKLRELGAVKGTAFLSDVLDGKIAFTLIGVCPHCNQESAPDKNASWLTALRDRIEASVDQRLKANEQALRYGLGTKDEVSLTDHPEWKRRMDALRTALLEIVGEDKATAVILRANELAGAR